MVVLDSEPFELPADHVDVRFAPGPGPDAADDVIVEIVGSETEPASLVVATSDRRLAERVRALGAGTISVGALRRRLDA
jgi:rRNA-processing protein FCF1